MPPTVRPDDWPKVGVLHRTQIQVDGFCFGVQLDSAAPGFSDRATEYTERRWRHSWGSLICFLFFLFGFKQAANEKKKSVNPLFIIIEDMQNFRISQWLSQWYHSGIIGGNPDFPFVSAFSERETWERERFREREKRRRERGLIGLEREKRGRESVIFFKKILK